MDRVFSGLMSMERYGLATRRKLLSGVRHFRDVQLVRPAVFQYVGSQVVISAAPFSLF